MSSSSFTRWLWVAPLTVVVALAANFVIRSIAVALDPGLSRSGQLQGVYVGLTLMGSVAAMLILGLLVLTVARPLFWFRIVAIGALLVSWIPDIGLAMGGRLMLTSMQVMGPLVGLAGRLLGGPQGGPPPGAGPGGPPPGGPVGFGAGGPPASPLDLVATLMLMHLTAAVVCVVVPTLLLGRGVGKVRSEAAQARAEGA
jgi:hypothetical protein